MPYVVDFRGKSLEDQRYRVRSYVVERPLLPSAMHLIERFISNAAGFAANQDPHHQSVLLTGRLEVIYVAD